MPDRTYYPEPGDWVETTRRIEFSSGTGYHIISKGAIGRMIREEFDDNKGDPSQSAHDYIVYVCDFGGREVRCGFGDVEGVGLLDQLTREIDRD